jgi:hypothetical protein
MRSFIIRPGHNSPQQSISATYDGLLSGYLGSEYMSTRRPDTRLLQSIVNQGRKQSSCSLYFAIWAADYDRKRTDEGRWR